MCKPLSKKVSLKESSKGVTIYFALPALGSLAIIFGWLILDN